MNYDFEKMRQEFINKCGYEPTTKELLTYIKNQVEMNNNDAMNSKDISKKAEVTTSILLLIWFASSIITLMYFSSIERPIELMLVFGHYFLVFGVMVFLANKNIKNFSWLFLAGIAFMITLVLFPGIIKINLNHDMFMFLILGLIFFIVGIVFIGKSISDIKVKNSFIEINAKVVGYEGDDELRACIFEYNFNGQEYKVTDNVYTSGRLPKIGDIKNIRVNPDKPDEIVFQVMSGGFLILAIPFALIGAVFVIVALIA